ncbi:Type II site-specific deoxyribonuclease [Acidithiobacillus ferrivorans]|uniref:Type II site-specific deoxyribonuclease n=1 Tax=Acidithiobacillus ferrivorans TaxID=160808 RepID=A0A060UZV4_9PROT|nr:type II restriction endonuclease [Acidithiobacillus ferrivorans]CDQ11954.1 Type II site-specific deoxyribonuclease [Acidithiobacillus ferrivorans]SMH65510.1 Type II site-specific deoxyribonuclease [Acidithiobacillus ferrivorans]
MKQGYLSQYFDGVALKRLSVVEADVIHSNQHEFNGVEGLRGILGEPDGKVRFSAKFLYLTDQDDEPIVEDGFLTWYDARQKARLERGILRSEYRLYFPTNLVSQCAAAGDLLVIAKQADNTLLAIVAEKDTTIERQIMWLFGFSELAHPGFSVKSELETEQDRIGFAARVVLEQIGVEAEEEAPNYLDEMLQKFNGAFPKTIDFSAYARSTIRDLSSCDDPDAALVAWMEREEILFRTLEKHLLGEKLRSLTQAGVEDTEPFIKLVQSALQRRKSRAGSALENHLEQIFTEHGITYTRTGVTENNLKPDFIFPGIGHYHDSTFPETRLTMLASKSTCKDRWRQILNEAARIPDKHLLTLEPSISENQTNEMKAEQVQLVLPRGLHPTYTSAQQAWLMGVNTFTELARQRQNA